MKKIICLGSATKDIFVSVSNTKILENPDTEDLTAKKFFAFEFGSKIYAENLWEEIGGSAVNVAASLAKCDKKPFVFSRVSKSEIGKWIVKKISGLKIKKNYLQKKGGRESEVSIIISDKNQTEHVVFRTGDSVESFEAKKAFEKFREKVDWIFIASQKKNWEVAMEEAISFAKKKKAKIALNPSSFQISSSEANKLVKFIPEIEIIFLNRDEAIELVQNAKGKVEDKIEFLFEELFSLGGKTIVITDAEKGAYVGDRNSGVFHLKVIGEKKVETTGAGDAFSGGFLAAFMEGKSLQKALVWGIANSGAVISKRGATKGLLNRKELQRKELEMVDFVKKIS